MKLIFQWEFFFLIALIKKKRNEKKDCIYTIGFMKYSGNHKPYLCTSEVNIMEITDKKSVKE